jgi:hypothetical protein
MSRGCAKTVPDIRGEQVPHGRSWTFRPRLFGKDLAFYTSIVIVW